MDRSELDEIVGEFVTESYESLDELDRDLVALEQHADPDVIARIFRTMHTIKGTSGFLGFGRLEAVAHVGENLLSRLRDGELEISGPITDALLATLDVLRSILTAVEATGEEPSGDDSALLARLGSFDGSTEPASPAESAATGTLPPVPAPMRVEEEIQDLRLGSLFVRDGLISQDQLDEALRRQAAGDPRPVGELLVEEHVVTNVDVEHVLDTQARERAAVTESIRVDVGLLDDLMNLVGELVLARNQILQFTHGFPDPALIATSQRLNLITTELQEGVMKTRMQPIENVWNKFPRVVRDLTAAVGKQARLEMEGKHTELDKTLLEAIKDPLTHLVRNAVDHGLELPEQRIAAGKPAQGTVRLRAFHEGGQVIIELSDDGGGIDPDVIRRKAVEKGVFTAEEAAARSDREIIDVIFEAGFSTAATVSNISGRGVGMDVVRTNIESIGGSVDVHSVVGVGSTFKVKIPLTLAIIPALVVTSGENRYAIPQVSLVELVHADLGADAAAIEHVNGAPVFRLRGDLLPLVFLAEVLGRPTTGDLDVANIVVLQADDRRFGLVVDHITDTAEIVVKPLGRLLKQAAVFSGATIMGDGLVALILDVVGVAQRAEVGSTFSRSKSEEAAAAEAIARSHESMLLVGIGERRFVLPLATVARLEELPVSGVRDAGDRQVIHYRDEILPLVPMAQYLGVAAEPVGESLSVLVCVTPSGRVGLIVDEIHDIADELLDVTSRTTTFGIRGTTVVHGEVTDVLDLEALVRSVVGNLEEVA